MRYVLAVCYLVVALSVHAEVTPSTEQAASVLFRQYETVAFTQTDFLINSETHNAHYIKSENALRFPFVGLLAGLVTLSPATASGVEENYHSFLMGARNFVSPEGLGMVGSDQCYVGISESSTQPDLEPYFRNATYESVGGREVWTWFMAPYEAFPDKTTKYYAAQVHDFFLLCHTLPLAQGKEFDASNRKDFEVVAAALTAHASKPTVSAWEVFNGHNFWIHRSVLQRDEVASASLAPDVTALTLYADMADDRADVTYQVERSNAAAAATPQVLRGTQ